MKDEAIKALIRVANQAAAEGRARLALYERQPGGADPIQRNEIKRKVCAAMDAVAAGEAALAPKRGR